MFLIGNLGTQALKKEDEGREETDIFKPRTETLVETKFAHFVILGLKPPEL